MEQEGERRAEEQEEEEEEKKKKNSQLRNVSRLSDMRSNCAPTLDTCILAPLCYCFLFPSFALSLSLPLSA